MSIHSTRSTRRATRSDRVIDHMVIAMAGELVGEGLAPDRAADAAMRAIRAVCRDFGGEEFYMPKMTAVPRTETAAKLFEAWRAGATFAELSERYGFSARWVRQLVGEERADRQAEAAGIHAHPTISNTDGEHP